MGRTHGEDRQPSQETLTRNWDELLQEIRVTQTGVQILTGFLLTVPFSNRFADLTTFQRNVYLAVLAGSVLTTGLVVAPVAMHRVLFRQRRRELLVESGNRFAMAGLAMLALTVSGRRAARRRHRASATTAGWVAGGAHPARAHRAVGRGAAGGRPARRQPAQPAALRRGRAHPTAPPD